MSTSILCIFLVSPLLAYATFLLYQEREDPLGDFHENFRAGVNPSNLGLLSTRTKEELNNPDQVQGEGKGSFARTNNFSNSTMLNLLSTREGLVGIMVVMAICLSAISNSLSFGLLIGPLLGFGLWTVRSRLVSREKSVRANAIESEFPAFAEVYTVLVVAGESPTLALMRISETFQGEFGVFLRRASLEIKSGLGLQSALENLAKTVGSKTIRRFVDALIIAIERGTPLADVLHRQVDDARRHHQVDMTKRAGKAEIALMIPVVFLILPISVLFALWPSYLALGQNMF